MRECGAAMRVALSLRGDRAFAKRISFAGISDFRLLSMVKLVGKSGVI
jgi:hypothetical protein